MIYNYPTKNIQLEIPRKLIHGTTSRGVYMINKFGISSRGFNVLGNQNPPISLDFGEGFYTSFDNKFCRRQVELRAKTKAEAFCNPDITPSVLDIEISSKINQDSSLKCVYFDGNVEIDGVEWAEFVAFHRVWKDKKFCVSKPCNLHPDVLIGPVADGRAISKYALDAYNRKITYAEFYQLITKSSWFPMYKQVVFGSKAIKYLTPVLKI